MKISHLISLIIVALVFLSCSKEKNYTVEIKDGVEIIKNKNVESTPNLQLDLNLISDVSLDNLVLPDSIPAINSFDNAVLDSEGNIYISYFTNSIVYKLDTKGNYVTNFHRKGQGPGESIIVDDIAVIKDSVYVVGEDGKVSIYNTKGDFLKQLRLFDGKYEGLQIKYSDNKVICATRSTNYDLEEKMTYFVIGLFLVDFNNSENYSKILEIESSEDINNYRYLMSGIQRQSCFFQDQVFVEDLSFNEYAIDVYNLTGKKIKRIEKQTRRIPCSDKFKAEVKELDEKSPWVKLVAYHMKQILRMYVDNNGYLWIKPAVEGLEFDHQYYDIFNAEGIFLKRIKLPLADSFEWLYFDKGKLIVRDPDNCVIKVFDYEFL
jgi:hypothetical protein